MGLGASGDEAHEAHRLGDRLLSGVNAIIRRR